jgi:hypothetical protein
MLMVEHVQNNWHQIYEELGRWRGILTIPWDRYKESGFPGGI